MPQISETRFVSVVDRGQIYASQSSSRVPRPFRNFWWLARPKASTSRSCADPLPLRTINNFVSCGIQGALISLWLIIRIERSNNEAESDPLTKELHVVKKRPLLVFAPSSDHCSAEPVSPCAYVSRSLSQVSETLVFLEPLTIMGSRRRNEPYWPGSTRETRDYPGYGSVYIETRSPRDSGSRSYGGSGGGGRQPVYDYEDYSRPSGGESRRSRYDDESDYYAQPEPRRERSPPRRYVPQRERSCSPEPTHRRRPEPCRELSYSPGPARRRRYSPERGPGHDLPRAPTPPPAVRPSRPSPRPEASSSTPSAPSAPKLSARDRRTAGYNARLAELNAGAADRAQRQEYYARRYGGSRRYGNYSDSD